MISDKSWMTRSLLVAFRSAEDREDEHAPIVFRRIENWARDDGDLTTSCDKLAYSAESWCVQIYGWNTLTVIKKVPVTLQGFQAASKSP